MKIIERSNDIFNQTEKPIILRHCVSQDDNLAQGIAKQFKKHYPDYAHYFFTKSYQNQLQIGTTDYYYNRKKQIIIFSLINKGHYSSKPHPKQMQKCLNELCQLMLEHHLDTINLPKIGAGIDYKGFASTPNKAWKTIKKMIQNAFQDTNITIIINKK